MQDSVFKEYDIRGKVNGELTIEDMYDLGLAIGYFFKEQAPDTKRVLIGMDARSTSPIIKDHLCKALQESGFDIVFVGICPSPVVYFGLFTMKVDAALVITASHNPAEYNGIKVCLQKKFIWGKQIRYIGQLFRQKKSITNSVIGTLTTHELIPDYVAWMYEHFPLLHAMPLSAAIDTGNGTGGTVIPALMERFGWQKVSLLCGEVGAENPRHEADPVVEKNMICVKEALQTGKYDLGVGIDGDGDRMDAMTKKGFLIPGDQLLALFAQPIVTEHPGSAVVFDAKSSDGLIEILERWHAKPVMAPSGHAIIKEYMHTNNALLGGELSCHFFFQDRYFGFDDGIYAMLRLFESLIISGKSIDELIAQFPAKVSSPEIRLACDEEHKRPVIEGIKRYFAAIPDAKIVTLDGVRATVPYGWGIVRASNTQPVLSIRFEANNAKDLDRVKNIFISAMKEYYDVSKLKKEFDVGD